MLMENSKALSKHSQTVQRCDCRRAGICLKRIHRNSNFPGWNKRQNDPGRFLPSKAHIHRVLVCPCFKQKPHHFHAVLGLFTARFLSCIPDVMHQERSSDLTMIWLTAWWKFVPIPNSIQISSTRRPRVQVMTDPKKVAKRSAYPTRSRCDPSVI